MNKLKRSTKRASWLASSLMAAVLLIAPSVAMAATGTTSSSATAPSYVSQFGSAGTGNGQLANPQDLAIASNGNIYVADNSNNRVQEFTSDGAYVSQFGGYGSGNGQFSGPTGLAIASNGNIYVADANHNRVQEFTSDGAYVSQFGGYGSGNGQLSYPHSLAIASNGNIYVADNGNHRVQEFTSDGMYVSQFGGYGSGNGQFSGPTGLAIASNGNIYVADYTNSRVQEFTSDGTYVSQFGNVGDGNGQFVSPTGLVIASNGNIYVADTYNSRIQEFTSDGTYVSQFGTLGSGNGEFSIPSGITIASNGNIYVADTDNNRVQVFHHPKNLGTVASATDSSQINLTLPDTSNISSITSSAASTSDSGYSYPLGLVNFTSSVASGSTTRVSLTFQTNLKPSDVIARKYNPTTKRYTDVPNATITETTVSGKHALKLTYNVTDGGALDQDGTVNGTIVDPVGLATTAGATSPNPKAPNTGYGVPAQSNLLVATLLITGAIVSTGAGLALRYRQTRSKNSLNS